MTYGAVYARFSCDRQSPHSIEDQIRKCREFADRQGWRIDPANIFTDAATSGATAERSGLQQLLAAAGRNPRPFDFCLIDDTSRLSRNLSDSLNLTEKLRFAGVRLHFVSQGFNSDSDEADMLLPMHGIMDQVFLKELGKKTFRGVEGRALQGLHTGGRCFGYKNVPLEDASQRDTYGRPIINGARLQIEPEEAKIVRRIFSLYAGGLSMKTVAKLLNLEGVRSPQPREGRQQSWAPSSIRHMLRNERYHGVVNWARTRKIRNPQNGRRIQRRKPESEWLRVEHPEQRIVTEQLWRAVHERLAFVTRIYGDQGRKGGLLRAAAASSRYIFSGLLKCGVCGANLTIVSGVGKNHKYADYGCPSHAYRATCTNARRVRRDVLETELLTKLQHEVLTDAAAEYTLQRLEAEMDRSLGGLSEKLDAMRKRKQKLEAELANLERSVASGFDSSTLRAGIARREQEISAISEQLLSTKPDSVRHQVRDLRSFVRAQLADMRALLNSDPETMAATRMQLARHIEAITIEPDDRGVVQYRGNWNLLGSMDGAGGQS